MSPTMSPTMTKWHKLLINAQWVAAFKVTARFGAMPYCLHLPARMHHMLSVIKQYSSDGRTRQKALLQKMVIPISKHWNHFKKA